MRCEELQDWLSADVDGEARGAGRAAVREHLAVCTACQSVRAAAEGLREQLGHAAQTCAAEDRDEALLAVLRSEGVCGDKTGLELWRPRGVSRSLPYRWLCGSSSLDGRGSLGPAVVVMAVSFLVVWGSLRWAESGRDAAGAVPASLPAAAHLRPPDGEMLDRWMAGTPTLAALQRLQWLPASAPEDPAPIRRGAALRERRQVG